MQKEKLKKQKGITLIALVITTIVMLILVGVTVTVALQGGLFNTAKDAAQKTADAAKQETEMLYYEYEIASATGKTDAESFTEYVLDTKYSGLEIGDYVNYNELSNGTKTYTTDTSKGAGLSGTKNEEKGKYDITEGTFSTEEALEWRVLGVTETGQLELISDRTANSLCLSNEEGYLYGIDNLNNMCNELYGKGLHAELARSVDSDDLIKLTDYDPSKSSTYGEVYQYCYSVEESCIEYRNSKDNGVNWSDWTHPTGSYAPTPTSTFRAPGSSIVLSSENLDLSEQYINTDSGYQQLTSSTHTDMFVYCSDSTPANYWISSIYLQGGFKANFRPKIHV